MYHIPPSQTAATTDTKQKSLVVSENLTPSVASTWFPVDLHAKSTSKSSAQVLKKRQDSNLKRQSRHEKEAIRKRIYHQKVKDERNGLRRKVEELSRQLQELTNGNPPSFSDNLILLHSVWKDFAIDEHEKLLQSETEQIQLLAAIKARASCLEEMCKQVARNKLVDILSNKMSSMLGIPKSPPFDYTMYRGHLRRLHESYALVDAIFDFDSMTEDLHSTVKRRELDGEIEYFEHRKKFTQPFQYNHTAQMLWKSIKLNHRQQDREEFKEVADPNNTIVIRFRLIHTLTCGSTVSVLQRHVVSRFVEKNRTVHVWKTHSEGEGIFCGMHSDETGWIFLQPSADPETTEVMVYVRQAPMKLMLSNAGDARVDEFHEILQRSVSDDMLEIRSELDKRLLEETLAGIEINP